MSVNMMSTLYTIYLYPVYDMLCYRGIYETYSTTGYDSGPTIIKNVAILPATDIYNCVYTIE